MDSDGLAEQRARALPRLVAAPWLMSLLALGLGLAATFAFASWREREARREDVRRLEAIARSELDALSRELRGFDFALRGLQVGLGGAPVTRERFEQAASDLGLVSRLPGLQAVVYSERRPGPQGEAYPTVHVYPAAGNERVVGLDVRSQASNLAALQRSRDTDVAALSAPFRLIQDPVGHSPDGLLLRLPLYGPGPRPLDVAARRARFVGSFGISFRMSTLAERAFPSEWRRQLALRIVDLGDGTERIVHDSRPAQAAVGGWSRRDEIDVGGRRWRVEVAEIAPPRAFGRAGLPMLAIGGLASLLLSLWIASLANARRRAVEIGEAMSARYRDSEQRFRAVNELLPALVVLARVESGEVTYANQAARVRLGEGVDGARFEDLFEEPDRRAELLAPGGPDWEGVETVLRSTNGDRFWASLSIRRVTIGGREKFLLVASDISQQRQLTELLTYQASHDALTELYNRREFERLVERALAHAAAGGPVCALLYVDLDQFKLINDTSGHSAGDQLLAQLAGLMREQLRGSDALARLGGDEFGVLACDVHDTAGALLVAERLRQHIDSFTFVWDQSSYGITASIGGVLLDPQSTLKEAFARADTACYMAKDAGRNRVHFYSASDDAAARRRTEMEWAHRLRWALDKDRLRLFFQEVHPLAGSGAGDATRVEVLLRLCDEDGRIVPPGAFIPAAERFGLMPAIDRWVIETTLAHLDRIHPQGDALQFVAINLSGATLEDEGLVEFVAALVARHGVDPRRLCFEITETVAVRNLAQVSRLVGALRRTGCRIALDDFGAGMSSFGYLKNLPVDIIKIDGGFVRDLLSDPMSQAIVRAVTDIGHQRGLQVVAEWVDSLELVDALAAVGVDLAQGFVLHRPELAVLHRPAVAQT
ncbi:bifunctional diguanylate cyclase/phosphodiesterase [Lysobacter humi (ex Lee et al. 2017)]